MLLGINYKTYHEDSKNIKNRLDCFIHYCDKDAEIMIDPIDNIKNDTFKYKIDMLQRRIKQTFEFY